MEKYFNTRILVIDDDENVRGCFREILRSREFDREDVLKMEEFGAALFDSNTPRSSRYKRSSATFNFEYAEAPNGKQGYEAVKKAFEEGRPFAAAFVDMRMPGWDGLETVQHLRQIDSRLEIIFVTAYSDYSIEEIVTAVGTNVSYHCKPFSVEEIEQIATKAVYEWNKTRNLEDLIKIISKIRGSHWEMDALLNNILVQVAYLIGTHSALIAMKKNSHYEKILAIGNLSDDNNPEKYFKDIPEDLKTDVYQNGEFAYFMMDEFGILAVFEKSGKPLNNERIYLVRLFLEQAAQAIRNIDLQEALIKSEKMSAVGEATGIIAHDLKNSIGFIEPAIELIEEDLDNKKLIIEMLGAIKGAAREGIAFVVDILDFTANKKVVRTRISANDLLEDVQKQTDVLLKKLNIQLKVECPPETDICVDRNKLYRLISNLIKNAIESFHGKNINNPEIKLILFLDEQNIYISVSDNGPGISPTVMDRLFEAFSSHGKRCGTGLGLAIVKQFVDAHGGNIKVESSDSGTCFMITLPA
ncbi:MAG: ATP-binding protein [Victivallaceae bacterium]|jgi:signal transduction histidine kinase/DNA-binding response OmpR family regulator